MMYSSSLIGMFTGSYSSNIKVGFLCLQLAVILCCHRVSALLKTARSLLFRSETKVRAKYMCTSDTQMTRDGRVSSQSRSQNPDPPKKGHVMMLFFYLVFPSFSGRRQVRHGRDSFACWRPFDLDPQSTDGRLSSRYQCVTHQSSHRHFQVQLQSRH